MNAKILEALAVTCAMTNTEIPEAAARVMVSDLGAYDEAAVLEALVRCRRELTGRLTLAAILERLDDGRPGPEEAWAASPLGEGDSVVWTPEWAEAFYAALPHVEEGDRIAARMTFLEHYRRGLSRARGTQQPPRWTLSHGFDVAGREKVVLEAVRAKRIGADAALKMLPTIDERALISVAPEAHALIEARYQIEDKRQPEARVG